MFLGMQELKGQHTIPGNEGVYPSIGRGITLVKPDCMSGLTLIEY